MSYVLSKHFTPIQYLGGVDMTKHNDLFMDRWCSGVSVSAVVVEHSGISRLRSSALTLILRISRRGVFWSPDLVYLEACLFGSK